MATFRDLMLEVLRYSPAPREHRTIENIADDLDADPTKTCEAVLAWLTPAAWLVIDVQPGGLTVRVENTTEEQMLRALARLATEHASLDRQLPTKV